MKSRFSFTLAYGFITGNVHSRLLNVPVICPLFVVLDLSLMFLFYFPEDPPENHLWVIIIIIIVITY